MSAKYDEFLFGLNDEAKAATKARMLEFYALTAQPPTVTPEGAALFAEAHRASLEFEAWLFGGQRRSIVTGIVAEYPDFDWHVYFRQGGCE